MKIRALFGLTRMPDGKVIALLKGSLNGLSDHADIFVKAPIDLETYRNGIVAYEAAIPAALDGSRTAIALKNKLREDASKMYAELAHYAQANCNEDMVTFLLSGFLAAPTTKAAPQPLAQPTIDYLVHGPVTGQLKVKIGSVAKALSYEFRYAPVPGDDGTPAAFTQEAVGSTKPRIISGLTPGTVYTFQVRALGRLGHTDWSDAVSRMVV